MKRPRMPSTSHAARAAISLLVLGLAACSFSFKSGSGSSSEAGKPAIASDGGSSSKPSSKPIAGGDDAQPSEPAPDPAVAEEPPPVAEPPAVVEPQLTAVCRVEDESLAALCHRVFDPIAADDADAWSRQLGEAVVLTRPSYRKGMQRLQGPEAVVEAAAGAGGLRALLHIRTTDRIVVTPSNDCRACRRSFVAYELNTRSGTVVVSVDMTQPPAISAVEVGSHARRRHLEEARQPAPPPAPKKPAGTLVAPKAEITPPAEEPKSKPVVAPKAKATTKKASE